MGKPVTTKKSELKPAQKPKPAPESRPVQESQPEQETQGFSIVGIGASAGGLEASEQFFRKVPPDTGMAFVLVSHLDPSHASILT